MRYPDVQLATESILATAVLILAKHRFIENSTTSEILRPVYVISQMKILRVIRRPRSRTEAVVIASRMAASHILQNGPCLPFDVLSGMTSVPGSSGTACSAPATCVCTFGQNPISEPWKSWKVSPDLISYAFFAPAIKIGPSNL